MGSTSLLLVVWYQSANWGRTCGAHRANVSKGGLYWVAPPHLKSHCACFRLGSSSLRATNKAHLPAGCSDTLHPAVSPASSLRNKLRALSTSVTSHRKRETTQLREALRLHICPVFISLRVNWLVYKLGCEQESITSRLERWAEAVKVPSATSLPSASCNVFTSATRAPDTLCVILEQYPQHSHQQRSIRSDPTQLECKKKTIHWSWDLISKIIVLTLCCILSFIFTLIYLSAWLRSMAQIYSTDGQMLKSCTLNFSCNIHCKQSKTQTHEARGHWVPSS